MRTLVGQSGLLGVLEACYICRTSMHSARRILGVLEGAGVQKVVLMREFCIGLHIFSEVGCQRVLCHEQFSPHARQSSAASYNIAIQNRID